MKTPRGPAYLAAAVVATCFIAPPIVHAQTIYRLNCGGPDYVDPAGNTWQSDNGTGYFNVGRTLPSPLSDSIDIIGTELDTLYRTERFDARETPNMIYTLPVAPGYYLVKLHFAEIYWTKANRRRFDVLIEGELELVNYDIIDGIGPLTADIRQFVTVVNDASLEIEFAPSTTPLDNAKISAIEVEQITAAPLITSVTPQSLKVPYISDCGNTANRVTLTADDPDTDLALLTWTLHKAPTRGTVAFVGNVASGAQVQMCYTPAAGQKQNDSFTLRVADNDPIGGFTDVKVAVTLIDAVPPILSCPANVTIVSDESSEPSATGQATATDAFDASPVVSFTDEVETRTCPESIRILRRWTARDFSGNSATCVQTIKVFTGDLDGDGVVDCEDECPLDQFKTEPGICGCGRSDADANNDGKPDCSLTSSGSNNGGTGGSGGVDNGEPPAPVAQDCCGGGAPMLLPFLLVGRRRRNNKPLRT